MAAKVYAFLFAATFFLTAQSRAQQQVLFSEDFEHYPQINFSYPWLADNNNGAFPWRCDIPYIGFNNLALVDFENKTKTALTASNGRDTNVLLMTPPIAISAGQHAVLSYDSYFTKFVTASGKSESATIELSTDNGTTWTVLKSAPVSTTWNMRHSFVDLGAAAGTGSVRLGFRYSDSGSYGFGWMVDNIKVFVPSPTDIGLLHLQPEDVYKSYYAVPASVPLKGTVMNWGSTPITAFNVYYREGSGPVQSHAVTGVNIAPLDTLDFVHSIPMSITTVGPHKVQMWVSAAGDTSHYNDTLSATPSGAAFMPAKKMVIEEGTGTWNKYSPRYYVYLHALDTAANPPLRISVHSGDVMEQKGYADYLYYMNQNFTPYFLFDRRGLVSNPAFFDTWNRRQGDFGFADLGVKGSVSGTNVSVIATIKPAVDMPGDYRLALVITEDKVHRIDSAYAQGNIFTGGRYGPMGGFETKPDPVPASDMYYDYVARSITPGPEGLAGCLRNMTASGSYPCNLQATIDPAWIKSKLNAVVLLIRSSDSSILNARSVLLNALDVAQVANPEGIMRLYPNPADNNTTVALNIPAGSNAALQVADVSGRLTYSWSKIALAAGPHNIVLSTGNWPAGLYFVTLRTGDAQQTLKLSVVH